MTITVPPLPQPGMSNSWQSWAANLINVLNPLLAYIANAVQAPAGSSGSNTNAPTVGVATMGSISSGEVTVFSTLVTGTCIIFLTPQGVTSGNIYEDISQRKAGASFVIKSTDASDSVSVAWLLTQPL